jgi:hypothetical protein
MPNVPCSALCTAHTRGYGRSSPKHEVPAQDRTPRREGDTAVAERRDAQVTRQRHFILLMGAVFTALVVCLAVNAPTSHAGTKSGPHKLTRHQKAAARRKLMRQITGNPRTVFKKGFLKKAQAVSLSLPLTLRLRKSDQGPVDDALVVVWDDSTWHWPSGFLQLEPANSGDPAPGGLVPLDGRASVEAQFGNDVSGYGEPGVVETTNGQRLQFSSQMASPIPVTGLPACQSSPGVSDPTVPAVQLTRMDLVTGEGATSLLSLFGGVARVSLHVRLATTTQSLAADCTGGFGDLPDGTYDQTSSGDPIVPITFDAQFRISPAIDADGRLRLGVLTLANSTQPTTFARISTCIEQTATDPCTVVRFPARLAMSQLNAEILVGDQLQ